MADTNKRQFYNDKNLCERWGCSTMTLHRMRRSGLLHSGKLRSKHGPNLTAAEEVERIERENGLVAQAS